MARITYVADVVYEERTAEHDDWVTVIEDQKGYDTPVSKTKRATVDRMLGCQIRIVGRDENAKTT